MASGKIAIFLGAVLLLGGGGLVGFTLTQKAQRGEISTEMTAAMQKAQDDIGAKIGTARAAVKTKAKTLGDIPALKNGLVTDAASLVDQLKNSDIGLKPDDDAQIIELGQIPKGGTPVVLLRLPESAPATASKHGAMGPGAWLKNDKAMVGFTASIESDYPDIRAQRSGFVTVTETVDLHDAFAALLAAGFQGEFELGDTSTVIGSPIEPGTEMGAMTLASEPQAKLKFAQPPEVAKPPGYLLAGGAGGAVFGLVLVIVGLMASKRAAEAAGAAVPMDTQTTLANASTAQQPAMGRSTLQGVTNAQPAQNGASGGQMFGRWEVVRRLGSGGMADVYLARARGEAGFEKMVALKVMHAHLARNERAVEHFLDEAKLAANVHHPNVVAIQDLGKIGDDYAIVMEYVDGVDLERLLMSARVGQRPVPVAVGLGILCRICDGLSAAHNATGSDGTPLGIIHRDVKSANVLVSRQGGVKVVDFGIAKAATQSHLTVAGETKGTPSMMAPEQRVGEQVDVRADVYSVAAVGFEILTNHGVNLDLAALAHLGVENWPHLPKPSQLRPDLPAELDDLLLGAMAFERDRRPVSCDAFESGFEAVIKKYGLSATDKEIARWVEAELVHVQAQAAAEKAQGTQRQSELANKATGIG